MGNRSNVISIGQKIQEKLLGKGFQNLFSWISEGPKEMIRRQGVFSGEEERDEQIAYLGTVQILSLGEYGGRKCWFIPESDAPDLIVREGIEFTKVDGGLIEQYEVLDLHGQDISIIVFFRVPYRLRFLGEPTKNHKQGG